jgi:hypothetical protein
MSTARDWYERKLGGGPVARSSPTHNLPPGYQPPPGYRLVPEDNTPPWLREEQQSIPRYDTSTVPRGYVTPENFMEMAKFWQGGQGRRHADGCPQCGGVMWHRTVGRLEAAPLCESCGYNGGLFSQGDPGNWSAA